MRTHFDTSVLVAAVLERDPRHERSRRAVRDALAEGHGMSVAGHSLAELFAVLTRIPIRPRISVPTARRLISESTRGAVIVCLEEADYQAILDEAVEQDWSGGTIYDALIARCARIASAERFLTWNEKDFRRVWPEGADLVQTP